MAHYAFLDENNIVTHVIPGKDEFTDGVDWENFYSKEVGQKCLRTSYNTRNGKYFNFDGSEGDQTKAFRKNYAGIGYKYDEMYDAFIPPQPFPSWTLNKNLGTWFAPIPIPDNEKIYVWNEENLNWIEVNVEEIVNGENS